VSSLGQFRVYSILFLLLFSPSFFYVAFSASSMAVGIIFTIIFTLVVSKKKLLAVKARRFYLVLLLTGFFLHFIVGFILDFQGFSFKKLLSFCLIALMILSAALLSLNIQKSKNTELLFVLKRLSFLSIVIGIVSLLWNIDILGYEKYAKSIFPFSEPSHYAITVGPTLFATGLFLSSQMRILLVVVVFLMGVLYPSLLLLVIALFMTAIYFISSLTRFVLMIVLASLTIVYLGTYTDNIIYFTSRLDFTQSTQNLTALVYLQGWQDMYLALLLSKGLGVGFQSFSSLPPGEYGEIIYQLAGEYKNKTDGGFLAAKIIGELGVFGFILILSYLHLFYGSLVFIVKYIKCTKTKTKTKVISECRTSLVFGHAVIVIFFIEIFGRGYGYFSPGVFLFLVALFLTSSEESRTSKLYGEILCFKKVNLF